MGKKLPWFKVYGGILNDPKITALSDLDRLAWYDLLAIASQQSARGTLPAIRGIAFLLHKQIPATKKLIERLIAAGLVDRDEHTGELSMHDWDEWQGSKDGTKTPQRREKVTTKSQQSCNSYPESPSDYAASHSTEREVEGEKEKEHARSSRDEQDRSFSQEGSAHDSRMMRYWIKDREVNRVEYMFQKHFYESYPKQNNRGRALAVWRKINPSDDLANTIAESLASQIEARGWKNDRSSKEYKFIPWPESWLKGRRWEDESHREALSKRIEVAL